MSDFSVDDYFANGGSGSSNGDNGVIGTPDNGDPFGDLLGDGNLFDGVNRETLPEDPFSLPKNVYKWRVISAEMKVTQNNNKKLGIAFKYEVAEGDYAKRTTQEWVHYWNSQDGSTEQQKTTALAVMQNNLKAFGYTDDEISQFSHKNYKNVLGREFWCMGGSVPDKEDPSKKFIRLMGQKKIVGGPLTSDSYDPFPSN